MDSELVNDLYELWGNLGWEEGFLNDLGAVRQWGKFQNRLVIVDMGLTQDVFSTHYGFNRTQGRPKAPTGWMAPKKKKPSTDYSTP